jgi:hypothetical protein
VPVLLITARAVAWALVALIAAALLSAPGGLLGPGLARAQDVLVVSGDVEGLEVGATARLRVTVDNPGAEDVHVRAVEVSVSGGGPGCDASALTVEPWTGVLAVPGRGSAHVDLALSVADLPACAEQSWDLQYAAS